MIGIEIYYQREGVSNMIDKLPTKKPISIANLTKEELGAEIEKGYQDILLENERLAKEVFSSIRIDYNLDQKQATLIFIILVDKMLSYNILLNVHNLGTYFINVSFSKEGKK